MPPENTAPIALDLSIRHDSHCRQDLADDGRQLAAIHSPTTAYAIQAAQLERLNYDFFSKDATRTMPLFLTVFSVLYHTPSLSINQHACLLPEKTVYFKLLCI